MNEFDIDRELTEQESADAEKFLSELPVNDALNLDDLLANFDKIFALDFSIN